MAIVTSGPYMGFSGTVDGITYSPQPNGTTVAKAKNTKSNIPLTIKQLAVQADTVIMTGFMEPLKEFVLTGYHLESGISRQNPYNAMVRCNRKNSIQGLYPHRSIDFSKILMTKGSLPPAAKTAVTITETGLQFTWSTELISHLTHHSDQVIMLAYFPKLKEARYMTAGAQRCEGKDLLVLDGIKKGYEAEVYISFITDDRRAISNSIYLGQLNW